MESNAGMASGSAQDVSENAYQKAMKGWETELAKNLHQASMYDAQPSYLKKSAGNLGTSLLTAGRLAERPGGGR